MKNVIFNPQLKFLRNHWPKINDWLNSGDTNPVLIEISPTNYCNASCPWCFYIYEHCDHKNNSKKVHIENIVMKKNLADIAKIGTKAISWTGGGEPTLHPNFNEFVKLAHESGLSQGVFTNALDYELNKIENPELLDWIRVSITNKGVEGISKKLIDFYKSKAPKTTIGACLSITKNMYDDLERMAEEVKSLGFDYFQIRPALQRSYKDQEKLEIPTHLKKYETDDFNIFLSEYKFEESVKPIEYKKCLGHFFSPAINYNGDVMTCMYWLHNPDYTFGNINENLFSDIWQSEQRGRIKNNDFVCDGCQTCCKNHEINKTLYYLNNPKKDIHPNFF